MNDKSADHESFRTLQLMTELESGEQLSQREIASRLGIAVGLVNSYLKNFVAKGYVRIKSFPRNRYAYLLTPKGFAEKSRLAFQHFHYFTSLYTDTRKEYLFLFRGLKAQGVDEVVFCGVDEVAEIAFLSLQEAELGLVAVIDTDDTPHELCGRPVVAFYDVLATTTCPLVISSLKRRDQLVQNLLKCGVASQRIVIPGEVIGF